MGDSKEETGDARGGTLRKALFSAAWKPSVALEGIEIQPVDNQPHIKMVRVRNPE